MRKQTYLIMTALVVFLASFALNSCNTSNPAEEPDNSQDSTIVENPDEDNDSKEETNSSVGALPGLFSVNADGKQIHFSQGNLQYTQGADTWSFAEQQYDYIGSANVSGNGLADKIDLFGWSGSTGSAKWGVSTSTNKSDYTGDFVDWGKNPIKNGGNKTNQWRTLTHEEWDYLSSKHPIGLAQVSGVNGLILLPDNWILPAGLSFKSGFVNEYSASAYGEYQSYNQEEWTKMESAGAVFLPASGLSNGTDIDCLAYGGYYWASTVHDESYVNYFDFFSDGANMRWDYPYYGFSVRLVKDVE